MYIAPVNMVGAGKNLTDINFSEQKEYEVINL